jgi:hypothetical protein
MCIDSEPIITAVYMRSTCLKLYSVKSRCTTHQAAQPNTDYKALHTGGVGRLNMTVAAKKVIVKWLLFCRLPGTDDSSSWCRHTTQLTQCW